MNSVQDQMRRLEELFSHQEHLLQQLNEVVLELRADHERLAAKFEERVDRLEARLEEQATPLDPNEKPPHY